MRLFSDNFQLNKPAMFFIGVTTHNSFVNRVFYDWLKIISKDTELVGVNLPVGCDIKEYLKIVSFIKSHPLVLGALVTTHKVRLYNSTKHLFDNLSDPCNEFQEVGCIYKKGDALCGEVTDIISVQSALYSFLEFDYFSKYTTDFCILGGGGAGLALAYRILTDNNPKPQRLILVDISKKRLSEIKNIIKKYDTDNILELYQVDNQADNVIEELQSKSIIVNATGLGKDKEGSPFSEKTNIPQESYLWEFNYRWDDKPNFYNIAKEQEKDKRLKIIDGWIYFIHSWTQVMSSIFHFDNTSDYFDKFLEAANNKSK